MPNKKETNGILKFLTILVITFIFLLVYLFFKLPYSEEDLNKIEDKKEELKKEKEKSKREKDSLIMIIELKEKENEDFRKSIVNIENKIQEVLNREIKVPESSSESVEYFNKKYKTSKNKEIQGYTGLDLTTSQKVILDIEAKSNLEEVVVLKDLQINTQDSMIFNLENTSLNLKNMLESSENIISKHEDLQKLSEENIEFLMKQVKKEQKKKRINKYLIPGAFIVGGFIGIQVSK